LDEDPQLEEAQQNGREREEEEAVAQSPDILSAGLSRETLAKLGFNVGGGRENRRSPEMPQLASPALTRTKGAPLPTATLSPETPPLSTVSPCPSSVTDEDSPVPIIKTRSQNRIGASDSFVDQNEASRIEISPGLFVQRKSSGRRQQEKALGRLSVTNAKANKANKESPLTPELTTDLRKEATPSRGTMEAYEDPATPDLKTIDLRSF